MTSRVTGMHVAHDDVECLEVEAWNEPYGLDEFDFAVLEQLPLTRDWISSECVLGEIG